MYCDLFPAVLIDISIDDECSPPASPKDGTWLVFIDRPKATPRCSLST